MPLVSMMTESALSLAHLSSILAKKYITLVSNKPPHKRRLFMGNAVSRLKIESRGYLCHKYPLLDGKLPQTAPLVTKVFLYPWHFFHIFAGSSIGLVKQNAD